MSEISVPFLKKIKNKFATKTLLGIIHPLRMNQRFFSFPFFMFLVSRFWEKMNKTKFTRLFHSTHHLQRKARTFWESVSPMKFTFSASPWILPQLFFFFSDPLLLAEMQRTLEKIRKTSCQTNTAPRCQCLRAIHVSG